MEITYFHNFRAISALRRSLEADPENIEALLDAGVSYTNELVQVEALDHLRNWLRFVYIFLFIYNIHYILYQKSTTFLF